MKPSSETYHPLYGWGAGVLALISALLIFFSSQRQSLTIDEPNHINCGLEYLQYGTYKAWPENPPLSRLLTAAGPYLSGYRIAAVDKGQKTMQAYYDASYNLDYFSGGNIKGKLFWARFLVLPVFLISVGVVWSWAKALGGAAAAFLAVGMYSTLPVLLAHSGLATTDITFMAAFLILVRCFSHWLTGPSLKNSSWLGISLAAALLSKYTVLAFFPIAAAVFLFLFLRFGKNESGQSRNILNMGVLKSSVLVLAVCGLLVWAFYGFSFGRLSTQPVIAAGIQEGKIGQRFGKLQLPAPEWFAGLKVLLLHNAKGHRSYLFGHISQHGFRSFYPVALFLKTPLPFLIVLLIGLVGVFRSRADKTNWQLWALYLIPIFIVASLIPSQLNLGLRHILPVYPLLAIAGGVGASRWLRQLAPKLPKRSLMLLETAVVACQLIIAVAAFPNYLSYFNITAGREPGALLVGSDLDWGQGLFALSDFCKAHNIASLNLAYYGKAKACWYPLPPVTLLADTSRPHGWVAVSEYLYRGVWTAAEKPADSCSVYSFKTSPTARNRIDSSYRWLDAYPLVAKAGGSIRIYRVP